MRSGTVVRSTTIVLGLLLMSFLLLYTVNEYEKNMAFQWENMVQPHWEGVVPQTPLLLPLASEKTDEVVISPDVHDAEEKVKEDEVKIEKENPVEPATPVKNTIVKNTMDSKKTETVKKVAVQTSKTASKKNLRLRMKEDLYYGRTAHWEMKKRKVMPDFFAPKQQEQSDVQLGGQLIMDDDEKFGSSSKKNQNNDPDYLDAIKGAELNISIKMR